MYKAFLASLSLLLLPFAASSQSSSINTFSPYTFYGLGDMPARTTAATAGMAGVGVASWSPYAVNLLNPASFASAMPNTVIFGMGLSGKNDYLESSAAKSSYNTMNVNDLSVMFPIRRGLGLGISIAPYSSAGYRVERWEEDPAIISDLGLVKYKYSGEGNISLVKASLGAQIAEGLSAGVELQYYGGTLLRTFSQEITPVTTGSYNNIKRSVRDEISTIHWALGVQYDAVREPRKILTFGATFQPAGSLRGDKASETTSSSGTVPVMADSEKLSIDFGGKLALGAFYRTENLAAGVDFTHQNWEDAFAPSPADGVSWRATNMFNAGVQYTPNPMDVRRKMNRWAYRAGIRYGSTYLRKDGKDINDFALSAGVGIPVKTDGTEFSIALEGGQTGTLSAGLVRDRYLKLSLGINIVSGRWFEKRKFN